MALPKNQIYDLALQFIKDVDEPYASQSEAKLTAKVNSLKTWESADFSEAVTTVLGFLTERNKRKVERLREERLRGDIQRQIAGDRVEMTRERSQQWLWCALLGVVAGLLVLCA